MFVLGLAACVRHPAKPPSEPLRFAVLGDRTDEPDDALWRRVVGSVADRDHTLVLTVGDLVDEPDNPEEWSRALAPLAALPRVEHTPGNHDIVDPRTAAIFAARTGQAPYRSFDVDGVHFVILDTSVADRFDDLPADQRTWLDADLAAHAGETILVFTHKPYWATGAAAGAPDALHQKLVAAGVVGVFTGHWHQHLEGTYDGVRYVGVGNSGGAAPGVRQVGTRAEHVEVSVIDGHLNTVTVVDGAAVPPVTRGDEQMLFRLQRGAVRARLGRSGLDVHVENVAAVPLQTVLHVGGGAWTPAETELPLDLAPGAVAELHVDGAWAGAALAPIPHLWLDWPLPDRGATRFEWVADHDREHLAPRGEPVVDGVLAEGEWGAAALLGPLVTNQGDASALAAEVWAARTDTAVVFAARIPAERARLTRIHDDRDGAAVFDDRFGVLLGPSAGDLVWFYVNPNGAIWDLRRTPAGVDKGWNGVVAVVAVGDDHWTVEASVPFAALDGADPTQDWAFDVRIRDNASQTHAQFTPAFGTARPERLGRLHLAE